MRFCYLLELGACRSDFFGGAVRGRATSAVGGVGFDGGVGAVGAVGTTGSVGATGSVGVVSRRGHRSHTVAGEATVIASISPRNSVQVLICATSSL